MKNDLFEFCGTCLKRHAGKCALAAYLAFVPPLLSTMDGQTHDKERPVVTGTATDVSSTGSLYISVPNTIVAAPNYSAPAPNLWQIVERTPGAVRPVEGKTVQKIVFWVEPAKPDKA